MAQSIGQGLLSVFTLGASNLLSSAMKPPSTPANPAASAPTSTDAAKQATLDEAKRAGSTGPGAVTNVGGASGILTNPDGKANRSVLMGSSK